MKPSAFNSIHRKSRTGETKATTKKHIHADRGAARETPYPSYAIVLHLVSCCIFFFGANHPSVVTTGPLVLLLLLGVTFYIGSRPAKRASTSNMPGGRTPSLSRTTTGDTSGGTSYTFMSSRATAASKGGTATLSTRTSTGGGADVEVPSALANSDHVTSEEAVEGGEEESPPMSPAPRVRTIGRRQQSVRDSLSAGPGGKADVEQVDGSE